jgi:uncharacterized membrane protein YdfJ with MMPL/SSD domain
LTLPQRQRERWPVVAAWIVAVVALHPLAGTLYKVTDDSAADRPDDEASDDRAAVFATGVVPIYVFVFMVALGVDYSVFLAARIREEARQHGAVPGISRGLTATGGVITAARVVLAGTFAALAERPLVDLVEVGTAISLGVLLDTLLVRALLVPALLHLSGARAWWPKPPSAVAQSDLTLTWRQPVS